MFKVQLLYIVVEKGVASYATPFCIIRIVGVSLFLFFVKMRYKIKKSKN